jgi:hypothetical protein
MSKRPGRFVQEFKVDLDRSATREQVVLSDNYRTIRNEVWVSVRRQVTKVGSE